MVRLLWSKNCSGRPPKSITESPEWTTYSNELVSIQPSHPLLFPSSCPHLPYIKVFQMKVVLASKIKYIGVCFSTSVLLQLEYILWTDLLLDDCWSPVSPHSGSPKSLLQHHSSSINTSFSFKLSLLPLSPTSHTQFHLVENQAAHWWTCWMQSNALVLFKYNVQAYHNLSFHE